MYEIYADDLLIYSDVTPLETVKVVNPKLQLADSAAGQLDLSLPPTNVGYSSIQRMVTNIHVYNDGEWLWSGRVLTDNYDFWNNRKMVCEGELGFLNDSIQPPAKYNVATTTVRSFLESLIDIHNSQVTSDRQFTLGIVTVHDDDQIEDNDAINRFTNYETTLEAINDKLLGRLKGHLIIRHQNGNRILDYVTDSDLATNSQIIQFGVNLLDFSKNIDMTELSTAIVPRGHRLEEDSDVEIEGLEPYLTVKTLTDNLDDEGNVTTDPNNTWHEGSSLFVKNPTAVNNFGWVCAVVDWDAVTVANNLYQKAVKYLKDEQYEKMTLEVKALDLKYLYNSDEPIKFMSKVRCVSEPHGMDHTFIVSKVDLDLANPNNNYYTLGTDVKLSLSQSTSRVNSEVQAKIDKIPSKSEILRAAERNAYAMISGAENSYVHFIPYINPTTNKAAGIKRIEVTDGPKYDAEAEAASGDPFPDSLNRWIWTVGGLGHIGREAYQDPWDNKFDPSTGQWDDPTLNVAMTMDGQIVADKITVGILKAVNNLYQIDTQTGYIKMEYAKIGPWYLNQGGRGLTDGHSAWLAPDDISCGNYGSTLIGMRGSSSHQNGYLEVGVNNGRDGIRVYKNSIVYTDHYYNEKYVTWNDGSDERIKTDIEELSLEEALKIVENTQPLTFRYKKNDKVKHYGVTAQRMEKECEDLGLENPFVRYGEMKGDIKNVDYTQFVIPLLKVVQTQQKEIKELERRLSQ